MYTGAEVARILRVDKRTVARWAEQQRIGSTRTPGGHRRYNCDEIDAIARTGVPPRAPEQVTA